MTTKETIRRYLLLLVGVCFIGLGIALSKQSNLGISPISSVANILSIRFSSVSIGTWIIVWNCVLILMQILILRKDFKPIQFLQFPISLLLGLFTDFCMLFVSAIPANQYGVRLALVFAGVVVLAFGITLTLISDMVMNVGEAIVDVIAKVLHKSFGTIKILVDIGHIIVSVLLSMLFFDGKIVATREGTIILALFTGIVIKWFSRHLQKPVTELLTKE